jgi:predicted phosphodiesterase
VFSAKARARKSADQPYTFVAFGDCAAGTPEQRAIAYQAYRQNPDFLFIAGDIVYSRGRISEYRQKFFPVYNADTPSIERGAPLLRSTLFIAAPGNHDIANRNLDENTDALAYFYYWMQPLNGLPVPELLEGSAAAQRALHKAAGPNFPRMVNFSFDYGNSHWLVLDSNPYVDISAPELTKWVEDDLKRAKDARWKFVAFHHAGFNSSRSHFQEQQMRMMAEVFEKGKVDIVFTGHVHNYQRSYPLYFKAGAKRGKEIEGVWRLDTKYDGKKYTNPDGVIYIVTGGGGAKLYNPEQQNDPKSWQEFTVKYVANTHSFTHASIHGGTLSIRQISKEGQEVDAFTIMK